MKCPVCNSKKLVTDIEGIHCIKCGFNIRTKEEETRENSRPKETKE